MTEYVLADGATIIRYPYSFWQLRVDNPHVSFPREPKDHHFAEFGALPVQPTERPDEPGYETFEADPVYSAGEWVQSWILQPLPRRMIPKWLIIERLTDEQLDAAMSLMSTRQTERWRASAFPDIYFDDPEMLMILNIIGADPAVVLGPQTQ